MDTIHTYEFQWWNGEEYESCELYSSERDDSRIRDEFWKQSYPDEVIDNLRMTYVGEGDKNCGMDVETGMKMRVF